MYDDLYQGLSTVASEAEWKVATDVSSGNIGERIGAERALAAFQGSRYVIENSRRLLRIKEGYSDVEFRQLDKILLNAAETPATIPDAVRARIEAEAHLAATLEAYTYCAQERGEKCLKQISPNEIDQTLLTSADLAERRRVWELAKKPGALLRNRLAEARNLRNRVATELGYSSYFHLQVADYGMSVTEMLQLMEKTVSEVQPLYEALHQYARRRLAGRYRQAVPATIPAHWLPDRWGGRWPGLADGNLLDEQFRRRSPQWIVEQTARFYTSLGWPALPKSFWDKSDLYEPPPGSARRKSSGASAWHIDRDRDVRCLMNVIPNFAWFSASHHELGHIYYYLAYSNPQVPVVLREGANRAFHEAVGDLIALAARQEPYLRQAGILPQGQKIDRTQWLLSEALDSAVVGIPFSAGVVTRFEYDLYEQKLAPDRFNGRWWELAARYQAITPPGPRGKESCDACTKEEIISSPARYYDHAIAQLIKYQLHDYIARNILRQDPHECNYYGNQEAGKWLWEILRLGATRDWRQVLREKTGEDLSSRAMLEYFRPLQEHLWQANEDGR